MNTQIYLKASRAVVALLLPLLPLQLAADLDIEKLEKTIEELRQEWHVPGVAVAIVQGDQILLTKGYGLADIASGAVVDGDTLFQLASVTKTFAAAGLALEVDNHKLKWDDPVINHLPGFALKEPYASSNATARDLLAHRTGLPPFRGDLLALLGYSADDILLRIRYLEPATTFRNLGLYSNVGFFAAGMLLEKLSGNSWQEAIRQGLLSPLQMKRSGFTSDLKEAHNVATPYRLESNGTIKVMDRDLSEIFWAAGGMISTARDMANWLLVQINEGAFAGKQLFSPEVVHAMHAPAMVIAPSFSELPPIDAHSSLTYGLGWANYDYHGYEIIEKGGALAGTRTLVTLIPQLKAGIVILCNLNLTVLPEQIRALFLEQHLGPYAGDLKAAFKSHGDKLAKMMVPPAAPANALPSLPLDRYTGTFANDLYGDFIVAVDDDVLTVAVGPARYPGGLTHFSNNSFILHWPSFNAGFEDVTFIMGPDGTAVAMETETLGNFKRADSKAK